MNALATTTWDPSLLSAGKGAAIGSFTMLQTFSAVLGINLWLIIVVCLGIAVFFAIVFWKLFAKANHKGYEALVSGHNGYVMITMAGKQGRYYFLFLIPIVIMNAPVFFGTANVSLIQTFGAIGTILLLVLYVDLTLSLVKRFGKGIGFGIGAILVPIVFYPILAFGGAKYSK